MSNLHVKFDQISKEKNVIKTSSGSKSDTMQKPPSIDVVPHSDHFNSTLLSASKVVNEPLLCALRWAKHKVKKKNGSQSTVGVVIASHPITLLLFSSPHYLACTEFALRLKGLEGFPEVVYIPVYTYQEEAQEVEKDFQHNHGDWWMMGFQTLGAVEAKYMCDVTVLPSLVVVNDKGEIVSKYGQRDLEKWGEGAIVAWY